MKRALTTGALILILLIGASLLLYPTVSEYWNKLHQTRAIDTYTVDVSVLAPETYDDLLAAAVAYNADTANRTNPYVQTANQLATYDDVLNIDGTGVMGYIEIPSIDCLLPVYHGTSTGVLQRAIGHVEWTSLPVGGASTHSVLSGHRGLPSAKLFTNLSKVVVGDIFMIRVLDETLTYEVDQILIVEPDDTSALDIVEGEDYCTLVTCTPYGVNTHRLLVRGHRIDNIEASETIRVSADAVQIEPIFVAPVLAIPLLVILLWVLFALDRKQETR